MKPIAIYITNRATAYGGAQPLRQVVLLVFMGKTFVWEQGRKLASGRMNGNDFEYKYDGNGMRLLKK